jgi:hypothetical protein
METRVWSEQQLEIFKWFKTQTNENLVVRARAGAAKTTSIIEGVKLAWDRSILLAAFNKRIQEELAGRVAGNKAVRAQTLHSVGFAAVRNQWKTVRLDSSGAREIRLTDAVVPGRQPLARPRRPCPSLRAGAGRSAGAFGLGTPVGVHPSHHGHAARGR